jgi:hypothetical protein
MLKGYLKDNEIDFEEKMVDQDDQAKEEMMQESGGFLGVPFTVVKKDGKTETITGFDKGRVNDLLGLN